ncbi:hypothetical protein FPOAC2_10878 [Fusarium poae]|jgi:hypothetical protein|uniref:hypothetical protein n=1 Tax=Fusarium poae TaxID=36050 RepID=UPI001CE770B3|nr:hypothetical protein FPOAC1_010597 [Fusarium poae]KAG8665796.1 hypothetical protein FPOAC1_010597 [Fusarium poae]
MAPPDASATSSKKTIPSSKTPKPSQTKKNKKESQPASTSAPRQPDEIEEADTTVPAKTFTPKRKQKRVESPEDNDTDDAESVYLSSDEETSSEEDSSDYDSDSDGSVEDLPPRQLARRSTDRGVKSTPGSPFTITQTRSETTRWVTTQNNGGMTRGARRYSEQTTMHGHNTNEPQRAPMNRNSVSFNMSINVDMSFNGLVTGRNLGFSGGSLSYAWNRRSTQGG